ncbi:hypothetical protein ACFVVC_12345 [Pseudarthrobacter sp. NPDC058196]|uniref:hypothetical protein n=1 Tax=Pseudarthrobacter sp. NPDC058196 TaxID=3346376 RepID=UPI0036DF4A8D
MWIVLSAAVPAEPLEVPVAPPIDDGVVDAIGEAPMFMPGSMEALADPATVDDAGDEPVPLLVVPHALAPMIVAAPIRVRVRRWLVLMVFMELAFGIGIGRPGTEADRERAGGAGIRMRGGWR